MKVILIIGIFECFYLFGISNGFLNLKGAKFFSSFDTAIVHENRVTLIFLIVYVYACIKSFGRKHTFMQYFLITTSKT